MSKHSRNVHLGTVVVMLSAIGLVVSGCGSSDDNGAITSTDTVAPSTPVGIVAGVDGAGAELGMVLVNVAWDANSEADLAGYNVYWSDSEDGEGAYEYLGHVAATSTSLKDEKLRGYVYTYKVTAVDASENESERSTGASIDLAGGSGGGSGGHDFPIEDPGALRGRD